MQYGHVFEAQSFLLYFVQEKPSRTPFLGCSLSGRMPGFTAPGMASGVSPARRSLSKVFGAAKWGNRGGYWEWAKSGISETIFVCFEVVFLSGTMLLHRPWRGFSLIVVASHHTRDFKGLIMVLSFRSGLVLAAKYRWFLLLRAWTCGM